MALVHVRVLEREASAIYVARRDTATLFIGGPNFTDDDPSCFRWVPLAAALELDDSLIEVARRCRRALRMAGRSFGTVGHRCGPDRAHFSRHLRSASGRIECRARRPGWRVCKLLGRHGYAGGRPSHHSRPPCRKRLGDRRANRRGYRQPGCSRGQPLLQASSDRRARRRRSPHPEARGRAQVRLPNSGLKQTRLSLRSTRAA
jgi:hypothetical protein